jgi:hypothetical protein
VIVDFTVKMCSLAGKPASIGVECPFCRQRDPRAEQDLLLYDVAVTALLMQDQNQTAADKKTQYQLLGLIGDKARRVKMEADDAVKLKEAIGKSPFNSLVVGQALDWIEGRRPFCSPPPPAPEEPAEEPDPPAEPAAVAETGVA